MCELWWESNFSCNRKFPGIPYYTKRHILFYVEKSELTELFERGILLVRRARRWNWEELKQFEVVNLELEVLKMKIIIIFIDLLMATVLFFVGRFFIKSRNTERSVLFLSGDYTGLNTEKICRVTGKRIKTWSMLFCIGGIIDFIKLGAGIIIVSVFFIILLVFHLVDMTINRDKYRV